SGEQRSGLPDESWPSPERGPRFMGSAFWQTDGCSRARNGLQRKPFARSEGGVLDLPGAAGSQDLLQISTAQLFDGLLALRRQGPIVGWAGDGVEHPERDREIRVGHAGQEVGQGR